jgi:hypothetical protein
VPQRAGEPLPEKPSENVAKYFDEAIAVAAEQGLNLLIDVCRLNSSRSKRW